MTQAATTEPELDPRSPRVRLAAFFDDGEFTTITPEDDRGVLAAVGRANGAAIPTLERPRRAGDPPSLIADAGRIRQVLDWQPRCDDLELIAQTSLAWERKLQAGPNQVRRLAHG